MKPIFCGNLDYDARPSDLERLFRKYGKVDRVDVKSGFAFVYMDDERDADDAIRKLDRIEFGRKGRRLRVEWTKQERGVKRPGGSRGSSANAKPSKTLFVINFDPYGTRERDLEKHFEPHGKVQNIRIRKNFAFIQFESQDDATRAMDATNNSTFMDRVISVEYAVRDDDNRRDGHNSDRRGQERSPRRNYDQGRSPSPYRRDRGSPDYGGSRPDRRASPEYDRGRGSPDYGRRADANYKQSPDYGRKADANYKRSPDYGRRAESNSKQDRRGSPEYDRGESPPNERYQSRSPPPRERSHS